MKRTWICGAAAAVAVWGAGVCAGQDERPAIAHIRMTGEVLEAPPELALFGDSSYMTLQDWLKRLAKARTDPAVRMVALEIDSLAVSWAQAQELSDAVRRLDAVKPVHVFLVGPAAREHLIAAAAREVALDPTDSLTLLGVGMELLFFRGTLDKVGIEPQFIQLGPYKGASEPFSRTEPSPQLKEQYTWLLDDLYDQLVGQLVRTRKLTAQQAKAAIDEGVLPAAAAKERKLVDRLADRSDWQAQLTAQAGPADDPAEWAKDYARKADETAELANPFALLGALLRGRPQPQIADPTIVIITASGLIVPGSGGETLFGEGLVGARTMVRHLQQVQQDDRIKAVVLRIDSPGGSARASEQIHQAIRRCAAAKPVIASIGQMGASGGYYIACGATAIYGDPAGLTGSIGVVGGKLALTGLLEKIGISRYEMGRGRYAGLEMFRPWTQAEQALVRREAERVYRLFVDRVKEGRGRKIGQLDQVTGGRLFTARQAKANGLIDEVGGFYEAVMRAQEAAGVKEPFFINYPRPRGLIDLLRGDAEEDALSRPLLAGLLDPADRAAAALLSPHQRAGLAYLLNLAGLVAREGVVAAVPHHVGLR